MTALRTPYRIETERLVIRCWDPADAPRLKEAIDASLDHLRPWMPWAHGEPTSVEAKTELLRGFRGRYDLDQDYTVGVFSSDEARVLGGGGLHRRGDHRSLEIGYWIREDSIGQGYATELTAALAHVAFALLEVARVEVWTATANRRSAAVPKKLGFTHEGVLRGRRHIEPERFGDFDLWTLLAEEAARLAPHVAGLRAYGVSGLTLLS